MFRRACSFAAGLLLFNAGCVLGNLTSKRVVSSISVGATSRGRLHAPVKLDASGPGYQVPDEWLERGNVYGTQQLVEAVARVGRQLKAENEQWVLGVADMSPERGGKSRWHRSHQNGRDVDLLFLSRDLNGEVLPPPSTEMIRYDGEGRAYEPRNVAYEDHLWSRRVFDVPGNWRVVEHLLSDPKVRVQWIFVSTAIKERLLRYAREMERPSWLIEYADRVLSQPGGVPPHDDHFHVRIYCPREDLRHGCQDTGRVWNHEKPAHGRSFAGERYDPLAVRALAAHLAWLPRA